MSEPALLSASLVSHTNIGKTTLARTLLRRDVGTVQDLAHVTDTSEGWILISAPSGAKLEIWDTPGFGDSARLLSRLRLEGNPLGWLLVQVWDRFTDRPLWCSQQAVRNVRESADVVLYLANAAEEPEAAGYLDFELEILSWIGRPVIVLLNQVGAPRAPEIEAAEIERWRAWARRHAIVQDVLVLDAFSRCWVQEGVLLERIERALDAAKRPVMRDLIDAWKARGLEVLDRVLDAAATCLAATARDGEPLGEGGKAEQQRAVQRLEARLRTGLDHLGNVLIESQGLEGKTRADLERHLRDLDMPQEGLSEKRLGLWGSLVGGFFTGLAADVMAGGLTLGGGALLGAVSGFLGAAGIARAINLLGQGKERRVAWSDAFLDRLVSEILLRYLAVAHFGRGRGTYRELEQPEHWRRVIAEVRAPLAPEWAALWKRLRAPGDPPAADLRRALRTLLFQLLRRLYPESSRFV